MKNKNNEKLKINLANMQGEELLENNDIREKENVNFN